MNGRASGEHADEMCLRAVVSAGMKSPVPLRSVFRNDNDLKRPVPFRPRARGGSALEFSGGAEEEERYCSSVPATRSS